MPQDTTPAIVQPLDEDGQPKQNKHIERCERSKDGHVVSPTRWPPAMHVTDRSMPVQCEKCGAHVIIYADAAGDVVKLPGVTVVLPK